MHRYQNELKQIKQFLTENPHGLTVMEIAEKIGINRNSVAKYLDVLTISGNVEVKNVGPAKMFFLTQRAPLYTMLNHSSDFIIVLDKELKIIKANDNILKLMKTKEKNLIGKRIEEGPHGFFSGEECVAKIKKAVNGKECTDEQCFKMGNKEFCFRAKCLPTTFENGEHGVTLIFEDITERKRSEEKLRKLSSAVEQSPSIILITDTKGNIEYANPKFIQVTGYSKKEIVGKNASELGEQSTSGEEKMWEAIKSGKDWQGEFRNKKKNGKFYWEFASISSIKNEKGEIAHYLKVAEDITTRKESVEELRKSQEKYKKIFEMSPEAIVLIDRSGKILDVNGRLFDWLQYKPEEVIGKSVFEVQYLPDKSRAIIKEKMKERLMGKKIPHYDIEFTDKKGKTHIGRIRGTLIKDKKGNAVQELVMISKIDK